MKKPAALIIMDGYGLGEESEENAAYCADTPVLDRLFYQCPNTFLSASGEDVGLPDNQIGNSEVGHMNIGAGRVVYQDLPRISASISDGSFYKNPTLIEAMEGVTGSRALHLMGLVSDGGVHSHNTHLYALLEMAKSYGIKNVYIHAFLDGRDVPPTSGADYIRDLIRNSREIGVGKVATVMGRYYAMDRDNRWERVSLAYSAMVYGDAEFCSDPVIAIERSYSAGVSDEFVKPIICSSDGMIRNNDTIIFFNFRPDRARELTYAMTAADFEGFPRRGRLKVSFYCMTQYDAKLTKLPVLFSPVTINGTFGEYISNLGLSQLRIAETEKYAHVTFFFNGGREAPYLNEDRVLIPSPKDYATYDLIPQMSAHAVAEEAVNRINSGLYDVIVLNFANCDMVGHTGVRDAALLAVEAVDDCVGKVVDAILDAGGFCLITADHGNVDIMFDENANPHTAHTTNVVPLICVGVDEGIKVAPGRLADIIPTMLDLMGLDKPPSMTGESLLW